jgi:hypothetical protein
MPALDRASLKEQLLREYAALLEERLPEGPLTLEEIETVVEELGRQQDRRLEELLIEEQTPPPDNQVACPHCHAPARFKRQVPLEVLTMHGTRLLRRRWHHCMACRRGFAPLDLQLRIEKHATRQVRAWQAKYGSLDAFVTVPDLLRDLRGLVLSESTVERTTLEVGAALLAAERTARTPAPPREEPPASTAPTPRVRRGPGVERLYLEMDGVYVPLRDEWRKDGSLGKLHCRYGECKVGVVFQADRKEGLDEGVLWRAYTATLEKIEGFAPRLNALAEAHGSERARELVVLGDGAEWIWNLCDKYFARAVQIVDYWHMTQHLYTVANARFGAGTAAAEAWVRDSQWYLDRDLTATVVARIGEWRPEGEAERKVRDTEYGYFAGNQERMRYATFLKRGLHIGSGIVEAGCRQLVTQRLKESGMHWREETAEAVLAIRAKLKSTAPTDLRSYC